MDGHGSTGSGRASPERSAAAHAPHPTGAEGGGAAEKGGGGRHLLPVTLPNSVRVTAYVLTALAALCLLIPVLLVLVDQAWGTATTLIAVSALVWMLLTGVLVGLTQVAVTGRSWKSLGEGLWATLLLPRLVLGVLAAAAW